MYQILFDDRICHNLRKANSNLSKKQKLPQSTFSVSHENIQLQDIDYGNLEALSSLKEEEQNNLNNVKTYESI